MVIDKFNLVDFDGVDLVYSQGLEIPGLYEKLHNAISVCRYSVIFDWKFNGIEIPPSYVDLVEGLGVISINGAITVDTNDILRILTIERVIERLEVTDNGTYSAGEGVDGFNPVVVNVPSSEPSFYSGISIPSSDLGEDGDFYNRTFNWGTYGFVDSSLGWNVGVEWYCYAANTLISTTQGRTYYKVNNGPAIAFQAQNRSDSTSMFNNGPVLVSTDPNAVTILPASSQTPFAYVGSFSYHGQTWYWCICHTFDGVVTPTAGVTYYQQKCFQVQDIYSRYQDVISVLDQIGVFASASKPIVTYKKINGIWVIQ